MPTYGYQCTECGHEFQVFQSMKEEPIRICAQCDGVVKRLLYPVGIVFKGSGWYINDSRKPEKQAEGDSAKPSEDAATPVKAEAGSSETKSASGGTKTESPAAVAAGEK